MVPCAFVSGVERKEETYDSCDGEEVFRGGKD